MVHLQSPHQPARTVCGVTIQTPRWRVHHDGQVTCPRCRRILDLPAPGGVTLHRMSGQELISDDERTSLDTSEQRVLIIWAFEGMDGILVEFDDHEKVWVEGGIERIRREAVHRSG